MESSSQNSTAEATRVLVELLAAEACVDVFAAHNVALRRVNASEPVNQSDTMTSVIGFSGPGIWGMCLLTSDRSPIAASNACPSRCAWRRRTAPRSVARS